MVVTNEATAMTKDRTQSTGSETTPLETSPLNEVQMAPTELSNETAPNFKQRSRRYRTAFRPHGRILNKTF
jgi:hypothetical protein